ncbi:DNA/RNA nuclease SfsA [Lacticaseibacillus mingshuiensis]|uniref:Sugar fermentation stimulation protein homolog n=1 Tax=Lacticaseibacillus mingshuiensis TaxID=2799574 RepID=A0ABW4CIG7_9LACO|nr:DNA/RNA nuclease SfsA [Lacticaseibacillus mingshuiensis]
MRYQNVQVGHVIERVSRFTVMVALNHQIVATHISNTGRNKELLRPGAPISVAPAANPERKTHWDVLAVRRDGRWINIDSLAPNRVVRAGLMTGTLKLPGMVLPYEVHPETVFGDSRIDFAGRDARGRSWLAEVKGVTLANGKHAAFPDAPTERGLKHVHTLTDAVQQGIASYLVLVVQLPGIATCTIYDQRFPELTTAVAQAQAAGVKVLAIGCQTGPGLIELDHRIKFDLARQFTEVEK